MFYRQNNYQLWQLIICRKWKMFLRFGSKRGHKIIALRVGMRPRAQTCTWDGWGSLAAHKAMQGDPGRMKILPKN